MPSIFGDTDEISFGTSSREKSPGVRVTKPISPSLVRPTTDPAKTRASSYTPRPRMMEMTSVASVAENDPAPLVRLVDSMKPTFLPTWDEDSLRIVPLSPARTQDSAFLIRAGETALLYGTGFSQESVAGKEYPTFPDMRIVVSEKDRLAAWILLDDTIEIRLLGDILSALLFPPVYASRSLIARIRAEFATSPILEKCRFFELFTPDVSDRKIGDIEVATLEKGSGSYLSFRSGDTTLFDIRREIHTTFPKVPRSSDIIELSNRDDSFFLTSGTSSVPFLSGEIASLRNAKIEKHMLRFAFDTFYVDKQSIWVVAGYTMKDRKELAENGVLTFVLEEDRVKRAIIAHIYIDSRGFVHAHEMMAIHKEVLKWIRSTYEKSVLENPRIERAELVQTMRRELTKYCYLLTGRTPVVMPIILER